VSFCKLFKKLIGILDNQINNNLMLFRQIITKDYSIDDYFKNYFNKT